MHGGRHRTAALGPQGGRVELAGHGLVGRGDGVGEVPGVPVRLVHRHGGERGMHGLASTGQRGLVHGGPDEGVAEPDAVAVEDGQSGHHGRLEIRDGAGHPRHGTGDREDVGDVAGVADRGGEQQVAGGVHHRAMGARSAGDRRVPSHA